MVLIRLHLSKENDKRGLRKASQGFSLWVRLNEIIAMNNNVTFTPVIQVFLNYMLKADD